MNSTTFDINERLLMAIEAGSYEDVLKCLMQGARATKISASCGRTAVGQAALMGDAEILVLLLQSCEEPDMDLFRRNDCQLNLTEMEIDTTPEGMDKLEWDDEFDCDCDNVSCSGDSDDSTSLYLYYAKTFERTGHILTHMEEDSMSAMNSQSPQDPHTLDALNMAPIHYAAACGHVTSLCILIEHGAQVDVATSEGVTPLHAAAENVEVVRLLLKHKANPNRKTFSTGETPLHVAIRHRNTAVINQLLLSSVNINEPNNFDQTPLMTAIAHNLDEVAIKLIERGAKLNMEDCSENNALFLAVTQNNIEIAEKLLAKGARRRKSDYLLHHCVEHNYLTMAKLLIRHGENLSVRKFGISAIVLAIMHGNVEMLECLLQAAAEYRQQGKMIDRAETALLMAVQHATTAAQFKIMARVLFAYDEVRVNDLIAHMGSMSSSLNCYVSNCATPLSRAILLRKMDIAEWLIKEGADMSQICWEHVVNTLRLALDNNFVTLSKLLVHAGFRFPALPVGSTFMFSWKKHRIDLERSMIELNRTPLNLQALARIKIRQQMIRNLNSSKSPIFQATQDKSALSRAVRMLDIPRPLHTYLYDFDDLPKVTSANSGE